MLNKNFALFTAGLMLCLMPVMAQSLTGIESVEFDSSHNRYLISNGDNIIAQSASDGTLSVFGSGTAKFGMEVMDGVLYAITDGGVKGYDLETGEEVVDVPLTGTMLNGMASNGENLLWITDTFGTSVTQVNVEDKQNPTVEKIVASTPAQPNGIYFDSLVSRLVFINWGNNVEIQSVLLTDPNAIKTEMSTSLGNCDGITRDRAGNWYVSCWVPESGVYKIAPDFSGVAVPIEGDFENPADMDYNPLDDVVVVPNTGNNSISLIQLENPVSLRFPAKGGTENISVPPEFFTVPQAIFPELSKGNVMWYNVLGKPLFYSKPVKSPQLHVEYK